VNSVSPITSTTKMLSPTAAGTSPLARPRTLSVARRVIQTLAFEAIGLVVVTPAYRAATGSNLCDSVTLMLTVGAVATIWCGTFNSLFELVQSCALRRIASDRPHSVWLMRAALREATEIPVTFPVIYAMTGMDFEHAFMTDVALAVVYAIYGYLFYLALDRLRPLSRRLRT